MSINKAALHQAEAARKKYRQDTPVSLYSIEGEDTVFIAAYLEAAKASEQPVDCTKLYDRIVEAEAHLSKLCETGGRSWSLSIPVQQYDSDMVYHDMIAAAKELLALKRLPERVSR